MVRRRPASRRTRRLAAVASNLATLKLGQAAQCSATTPKRRSQSIGFLRITPLMSVSSSDRDRAHVVHEDFQLPSL
jgi:hypothetical protein